LTISGVSCKIPLINITKKGNMTIKNTYDMKDNQTFIITYTKKNGEEVTRNAKFILGKCGEYISKAGNKLFTYFDVDQSNHMGGDQYRSARDSWEIK
jgi:hypothetical protein